MPLSEDIHTEHHDEEALYQNQVQSSESLLNKIVHELDNPAPHINFPEIYQYIFEGKLKNSQITAIADFIQHMSHIPDKQTIGEKIRSLDKLGNFLLLVHTTPEKATPQMLEDALLQCELSEQQRKDVDLFMTTNIPSSHPNKNTFHGVIQKKKNEHVH